MTDVGGGGVLGALRAWEEQGDFAAECSLVAALEGAVRGDRRGDVPLDELADAFLAVSEGATEGVVDGLGRVVGARRARAAKAWSVGVSERWFRRWAEIRPAGGGALAAPVDPGTVEAKYRHSMPGRDGATGVPEVQGLFAEAEALLAGAGCPAGVAVTAVDVFAGMVLGERKGWGAWVADFASALRRACGLDRPSADRVAKALVAYARLRMEQPGLSPAGARFCVTSREGLGRVYWNLPGSTARAS